MIYLIDLQRIQTINTQILRRGGGEIQRETLSGHQMRIKEFFLSNNMTMCSNYS